MSASPFSLDIIDVAAPCRVDWDSMRGDDRVRHCGECKLNVYNISELSRKQAESLILSREGRLCARFFRRADGTILTRDCPVGLAGVRWRLARALAGVAALVAFLSLGAVCSWAGQRGAGNSAPSGPLARLIDWIDPGQNVTIWAVMGDVCIAPGVLPLPAPATHAVGAGEGGSPSIEAP
jgi:hypothetical protein